MDKTKLYKFLGQGFSTPTNTIVKIVAEREKDILIENLKGELIGVFTKDFVEQIKGV